MKSALSILLLFCYAFAVKAQDKNNPEIKPDQWAMVPNYSKAVTGQLLINLPAQATLTCTVAKAGDAKILFSLKGNTPKDIAPGVYDITCWGIKINSVTVEKGKGTRIFAGVLNSTVKKPWEVWTADGVKIYAAGSAKMVALLPGKYIVKTSGVEIKTTITDGQVTMFSYTAY